MSSQPRIADKFNLVEELSFEPIGCYYKAILKNRETALILILNNDFSNIARKQMALLLAEISTSHSLLVEHGVVPIIDIIDCLEGVALVMPYFDGVSLADYINNSKPLGIRAIKKLLKPVLVSLSSMHHAGKYHGFINFSTTWVTSKNQVVLLGNKIFHIIFNNISYINTSLNNTRINSCINKDVAIERIKCSIYADYYSVLIIIRSMLLGYITNNNSINNNIIARSLSEETRVYLTKTFCNKIYNNFVSINDWIDKIQDIEYINKTYLVRISSVFLFTLTLIVGVYFVDFNMNEPILVKNKIVPIDQAPSISPIQDSSKIKTIQRFNNFTDSEFNNFNKNIKKLNTVEYKNIEEEKVNEKKQESSKSNSSANLSAYSKTEQTDKNINQVKKADTDKKINDKKLLEKKPNETSLATDNVLAASTIVDLSKQEEALIQKYYNDIESKNLNKNISENITEPNSDRRYDKKLVFKEPKMTEVQIADKKELVMVNPISKEDYYIYCYLDSSCNIDWQIDKVLLEECLFERKCESELYAWLESPMEFTSSNQVNSYLGWLNAHNKGNYEILPDIYWTILAGNFSPEQNCRATNNNKFKVYGQYPEWVQINKKIALRGPVHSITDDSQCQVTLNTEVPENYSGKMLVRLIKTA